MSKQQDTESDHAVPDDEAGPTVDAPQPHQAAKAENVVLLWNNFITMAGLFLVITAIILLLTFGLFSLITPTPNPYIDIVGFLVIPTILVVGVIITPLGILFKSWRMRRKDPHMRLAFRFPRFNLNDRLQRRAAKIIAVLTFIMLPVLGVSGYHGYHYTDSVEFCAKACHSVMEPEATTFKYSSHARVSCAECHIGAGASWFVKAKLSGTRQVFATLWDTYSRPIPAAIHHLRPARETCEQCHWPQKFYGAQLENIVNFASDEHNTRREINMLLMIGGGDESSGRAEGIHKHMALEGRIEYVATDDRLQEIPWVSYTDTAGNELIYRSDGRPSSDPVPDGQVRQLDCMDCHNRPAHEFRDPDRAVDVFLDVGRIDTTLPYVKREAVKALVGGYPDVETAHAQIGSHLIQFYETQFPEIWSTRKASVNQAIDEIRQVYSRNFFPDMKVDWQAYPDNIGHKIFPGCFRCHGGRHINQHGEKISHECQVCHSFLNPRQGEDDRRIIEEGEFQHPAPLEGLHAQLLCHQCHTGGPAPAASCEGCHSKQHGLRAASLPQLSAFGLEPSPMFGSVGCEDCHDLSEPHSLAAVDALCLDCHDDEEEQYEGMLARWSEQVTQARTAAETRIRQVEDWVNRLPADTPQDEKLLAWLADSRRTMQLLAETGALHHHAAAINIYNTVAAQAAEALNARQALTRAAEPTGTPPPSEVSVE